MGSPVKGVQEIILRVPWNFRFRAGQYLEIELPDGHSIPLSIASAPHRLPELHLHYRSTPGLVEAQLLDERLAQLDQGDDLAIRGPFGSVCMQTPLAEPLLIIAGGTGGAQAMGLLDQLLAEPPSQPVILLWCADSGGDLYRRRWLESLDRAWLTAECIVDANREASNLGLQWLRAQAPTLGHHQIILSGSPGFVYAAVDVLEAGGISQQQMASDVFDYSPRESPRESPGPGQPPETA
jgi:CDP-4-dehydro-6-deoxyglucose reductase